MFDQAAIDGCHEQLANPREIDSIAVYEVDPETKQPDPTRPILIGLRDRALIGVMAYSFARWFDADDRELDIPNGPDVTPHLASALLKGPLFCRLDRVPEDIRAVMPQVQPNFVVPFERLGIDTYGQRFEVTLHAEGTVRGVGGLRVDDEDCQTAAPGLYVAGDAGSRELVTGAISGSKNCGFAPGKTLR